MRLLLVEDTEDVAEAIQASFRQRGDAIDCVGTVEAARETLAVNDYEVVILDVHLPDGEGTEILRTLRRQRKPTPVLMLTARMAVEDRVGALDLGGRVASSGGAALDLTRREFSLLEALMVNRSRVMAKERLFDRMFTIDEEEVGLNAVETYVARLRRKLEGSGVGIRTLRGLGYQLVRVD